MRVDVGKAPRIRGRHIEKQRAPKVVEVGHRYVGAGLRGSPGRLNGQAVGWLTYRLEPSAGTESTEAVPHVVMGNCAVAGTHKEVVACDIQRVSFVGAGRTEQFTSGALGVSLGTVRVTAKPRASVSYHEDLELGLLSCAMLQTKQGVFCRVFGYVSCIRLARMLIELVESVDSIHQCPAIKSRILG